MTTPQPEALRLADELRNQWPMRAVAAEAAAELRRLHALINTPELVNFMAGVPLEAAHQKERYPSGDKHALDWFQVVVKLATKAAEHHMEAERLTVQVAPEWRPEVLDSLGKQIAHHREKAVHHTITTAAACANWHGAIVGNLGKAVAPADLVRAAGEVA